MIKVFSEIEILETDRKRTGVNSPVFVVKNHPQFRDEVVLQIGNTEYSVRKYDLKAAIENATNVNRY